MLTQNDNRNGCTEHGAKPADEVNRGVDRCVVLHAIYFGDCGGKKSVVTPGVDPVEDNESEEAGPRCVYPERED